MLDFNEAAPQSVHELNSLGGFALQYAQAGFPVFPVVSGDKIPLNLCDAPCFASLPKMDQASRSYTCRACGSVYEAGSRGFHVATTDTQIVRAWWKRYPSANIGLATGDGLMVLDIDGPAGGQSLAALCAVHGALPATPEQRTGKGRHFFFRIGGAIRNSVSKLGDGIDVRGDGGFVVVAPSLHPNGSRYQWPSGLSILDVELADAPAWLLGAPQRQKPVMDANEAAPQRHAGAALENYGRGALAKAYASVSSAREHTRNSTINAEAFSLGRLVAGGAISEESARSTLVAAAEALGVLRDERSKTLDTIERGLADGHRQGAPDLSHVGQSTREGEASSQRSEAGQSGTDTQDGKPDGQPQTSRPDPLPVPSQWAGVDPSTIPLRQWLLGHLYCRGNLSVTVSPGGIGKTSLTIVEAVQLATGRKLHDESLPRGAARVWHINGEDPKDELDRRYAATCRQYVVHPRELGGRLFVNSGVETPLRLAGLSVKGQGEVDEAAFAHLEEHIKANQIDVLIIDPFVSSHGLPESDNTMIDRYVKRLARAAITCNMAIMLVHHTRKGAPGQEHDADSARGASALVNGARIVRVLNPMTKDEAAQANIREELRRLYFRASRDKQNLAPPDEDRNWYRMVGVNLGNGTPPAHADADEVGVATEWEWPDVSTLAPPGALRRVQEAVALGNYGAAPQGADWIGNLVAEVLDIPITDKGGRADKRGRARVNAALNRWLSMGALMKEVAYCADNRKDRPFIRVGKMEGSEGAQ
ncbi:MAG: bifunctional DNA primase/polymerase [Hyphomonadaceae bacterium]